MLRRATEVLPAVVGLKPTLTTHELREPPGRAAVGATEPASGVPTQVLLTIAKSPVDSSARAVAKLTLVIVSGASPVFSILTGTTLLAAAVPAGTDGNTGVLPWTVPTTFEPVPFKFERLMSASLSEPLSCSWW